MNSSPTEETFEKYPRSTEEFDILDICEDELMTEKKGIEKQCHQQELSLIHGGDGVKDLDSAASSPAPREGSASVQTTTVKEATRGLRRSRTKWEAKAAARQEMDAAARQNQQLLIGEAPITRDHSKEAVAEIDIKNQLMKNDQLKDLESGAFNIIMDVVHKVAAAANNNEEPVTPEAISTQHIVISTGDAVETEPPHPSMTDWSSSNSPSPPNLIESLNNAHPAAFEVKAIKVDEEKAEEEMRQKIMQEAVRAKSVKVLGPRSAKTALDYDDGDDNDGDHPMGNRLIVPFLLLFGVALLLSLLARIIF